MDMLISETLKGTKGVIDQKSQVEQGKTIQWSKEKGQKGKEWSTKHYTENHRIMGT